MTFDLRQILASKRAFRHALAARDISEKLAMLDELRARAITLRPADGGKPDRRPAPPQGKEKLHRTKPALGRSNFEGVGLSGVHEAVSRANGLPTTSGCTELQRLTSHEGLFRQTNRRRGTWRSGGGCARDRIGWGRRRGGVPECGRTRLRLP